MHEERQFAEALWVFTDEITSEQRRDRLIEEALRSGYNTFYLSVYQPSDNRDRWRMYDASLRTISQTTRLSRDLPRITTNRRYQEATSERGSCERI